MEDERGKSEYPLGLDQLKMEALHDNECEKTKGQE
jgi:hypothetical protein